MTEGVSAFQYPIVEEGNLSYVGASYTPKFSLGEESFSMMLEHHLRGCPLLEKLIDDEQAAYSCVVAVPITGYRKLFKSSNSVQQIKLDEEYLGEPPFFRPQIIAVRDIQHKLTEEDGVNPMWFGRTVSMVKGAKLGIAPYYRSTASIFNMLRIHIDPNLSKGSFTVLPCADEGFYFKVNAAKDLYWFLQKKGEAPRHRSSILTHVVSCCFEILRKDYSDNEVEEKSWHGHSNLQALSKILEQHDCQMWDEPDFKPEEAATALYPHKPTIPAENNDYGEEED